MATYNKNEMLPQRKEALEQWSHCVERMLNESLPMPNSHLISVRDYSPQTDC